MYDGEVIKKALDLVIDDGSGSEPEPRTRTPISVIAMGILNPDKNQTCLWMPEYTGMRSS